MGPDRQWSSGGESGTIGSMDNPALIDQYAAGPAEVRAALDGITTTELDTRPAAGAWTAREIVHHLADSETNSYVRLRRMLVDDGTDIQVYDQERWAAEPRLGYDGPIELPLAVLEAVRASSAALLRRLHDADFAGPVTTWSTTPTRSSSGSRSTPTTPTTTPTRSVERAGARPSSSRPADPTAAGRPSAPVRTGR